MLVVAFAICFAELCLFSGCSNPTKQDTTLSGNIMYLSIVYTALDPSATDRSQARTTYFYIYDISKKELKKMYSITAPSSYPVGVVDYKNSKVYYSIWGDLKNTADKAGDKLQCYDLKTHKTTDITSMHHSFNQITLFANQIFAISAGLESNGSRQLTRINPITHEFTPISPDNTDIEYRDYSIDYSTGEILTLSYSDFSDRHAPESKDNSGIIKAPPIFLSVTNTRLDTPKVIYTFSQRPYYSPYGYNWDKDPETKKLAEKTANNLDVAAPSRMDSNNILFLGAPDVFSNDIKLKVLHLDTKTVDDFPIKGVKYYSRPLVSPNKKGMFISLKMENGEGGMYYYTFANKKLEYLFSINDVKKDLLTQTASSLVTTEIQLIVE